MNVELDMINVLQRNPAFNRQFGSWSPPNTVPKDLTWFTQYQGLAEGSRPVRMEIVSQMSYSS